MGLPKVIRPEYSTTIPSSGKKIRYSPFTVREEKVLVLAAESGDTDEIANAITNILQRCVISPADFKVDKLALFDIEYLFLKARSKSAGESIEVKITDPEDPDTEIPVKINIDKIGVKRTDGHTTKVTIDDETTVVMKYPDISFFSEGVDVSSVGSSIGIVARCVSQIVSGDEVYNRGDMTETELTEWLESLSSAQYSKITEFFATSPKLSHTLNLKNPNTGREFTMVLEGLADFF